MLSCRDLAGPDFGFVLSLMFLFVGGFLIWTGHDIAGATVATGGLGSVITVFIYGRSRKSQVDEIAFGKDDVK